jgi:DNA ligase (NAD+)
MGDFDDLLGFADEVPVDVRKADLAGKLKLAREAYHNGRPSVEDAVYDAWRDELAALDPSHPEVLAVGAKAPEVSEWKKVPHGIPMGSLDKVNTVEEMGQWVKNHPTGAYYVTEKLDGISIHVKYEHGRFVQAITRGDGQEGEDITLNVARMKGVPQYLANTAFSGSLRGEVVLLKDDFAAHFPDKSNTRNTAAGTSKRYDGKGCEHLTVMFYEIVDSNIPFLTQGDQFSFLQSLGFLTPWWSVVEGVDGILKWYQAYEAGRRESLNYDIDGLVVGADSLGDRHGLGYTDGGNPKGAVAFKFAAVARETTIRKILRQTGGTGRITPVAVFDPVQLMGAEVTQASLYNWGYIEELGLDIGAKVLVSRANDVIPRVTTLVEGTGTTNQPPTTCDACGGEAARDGEYIVCQNRSSCPAQVEGRISAWISTLNILEWGDVLIQKLVQTGLVKTPADLYRLTQEQVSSLERMGDKSAANVLSKLQERNPVPMEQFVGGLSIPNIGSTMVKMVMDAGFDTLEALQIASLESLLALHGLGPVKARSLYEGLRDNRALIEDLLSAGVRISKKIEGALSGKSFCFTGAMKNKRPLLEQMVKDHGGTVKASVGKGLTYLVIADPNSTSSKAVAARKHGTLCLSEEDFLAMVGA